MNNIKFSVRINEQDLYRFNLFHTYTSTQGILSVVLFVLLIAVWIMRFSMLSPIYRLFYPLVAIIFLVYIPGSLKLRVKNQMTQEVFKHPLTYELTESGIMVSSPASEDPAELPWEYIYKISTWKEYLLIYSNRVNAYIIPKEDIKDVYSPTIDYIKKHVEDYKLQIK
ncbi:YcxB-like protein [Pseudobutyrivibrio sp. ACV-2]|uniref:YcxB family protein n=1 Tax=Pseudobutyrivibrio sp. ACV-2 TaxID=1520801 RepID=UPI000898EAC2|nr:YcxB family protein [Pseudobutyrivibrio sp. ACV-2]SEA75786.1 YcxB-like protein [Pseudobutyrivibrio sp. ACV-2]